MAVYPPYNPGNSESTRLNALIPGLFLFGGMLRFTAIRKLSKNQKIELKNFQFLLEKSIMKSTFSYSNVKLCVEKNRVAILSVALFNLELSETLSFHGRSSDSKRVVKWY